MRCPALIDLPSPPAGKTGWPWTEESPRPPETVPDGNHWPRVSIVTPSYNQGRFIEESIRSVLLQGYTDLEYIVIDGGSTDNSVEVIRKYEPWIAYWVSEPDRGQSHAINKGLARSAGRYFNWHNSDDVLSPRSLAVTAAAMVNHPQVSYVHGHCIFIDQDSSIIRRPSPKNRAGFFPHITKALSNLKAGFQPGCLMDRMLVLELGGVDEYYHSFMDYDLGLRLGLIRPAYCVDSTVVYFRVYPESKSFSAKGMYARAEERLYFARKLFRRPDLAHEIRGLRRRIFATAHLSAWSNYLAVKEYRAALQHALRAACFSPRRGAIAMLRTISRSVREQWSHTVG